MIYYLKKIKYGEKNTTKKAPTIFNLFFTGYFIPGIDFRFHWSNVPVWIVIASNIIVLLGYIFIIFVFNENSYASTIIQVEKKQQVISIGPYSIVRHNVFRNAYDAAVYSFCTWFLLGSDTFPSFCANECIQNKK
ncbi:hypothetical protein [Clostridium drakei]|uniref:hypothetical protein n=1 Tax=Clostridium drakei TaxID=332101 RepID=UPI0006919F88|nr:hypothetical protein [Clostridium drakei]